MNKNLINFLISIRNASLAKKNVIKLRNVRVVYDYLNILYREGLIQSYNIEKENGVDYLSVYLRTFGNKVLTEDLELLSTPSRIKIISYSDILKLNLKNKIFILSTSKGVVTHNDCLNQRLGGTAIFSC